MQKIIPFFFDQGVKILDVTAGFKKMWPSGTNYLNTIDKQEPYCHVTFVDGSDNSESDVQADFRHLPFDDNSFDCVVFDPPFTEIKNAQENHGVKQTGNKYMKGSGDKWKVGNRPFYFRGIGKKWIPPEAYFFQTWREFNRISKNGLIIKISERFKDLEEVPVLTYMDLAYNKRFNKKSQFSRCVNVGYRGRRKATGARSGNPQRVLSNYVIYKKDRMKR